MTNQLITYRLPIDYSLISLMSSISHVWIIVRRIQDGEYLLWNKLLREKCLRLHFWPELIFVDG